MSSDFRLPEEPTPMQPTLAKLEERPFIGVRMSTFLSSMVLVNLIWWVLVFGMPWPDGRSDGDRRRDDGKKQQVVEAGAYLVFVLENQTASAEQTLVMREAPNYVARNSMKGWRRWDKDSAEAQPYMDYAAKLGIDPPFICLVTDGRITNARTFPTLKEFSPSARDSSVGGPDGLPPTESQEAKQ
jgi:hypothetical protein